VRMPSASQEAAVVEVRAVELHHPSKINFYFSTDMPRARNFTCMSGDPTSAAVVAPRRSGRRQRLDRAVLWSRKDGRISTAPRSPSAWTRALASFPATDTLENLRPAHRREALGQRSACRVLRARGWLPSPGTDTRSSCSAAPRTAHHADAVDVPPGESLAQDSAFTAEPKVFETSGVPYLLGHQSPSRTAIRPFSSTSVPTDRSVGNAPTGPVCGRAERDARGAKLVPLPTNGYAPCISGMAWNYMPVRRQSCWPFSTATDGGRRVARGTASSKTVFRCPAKQGLLRPRLRVVRLSIPATASPVAYPGETKNKHDGCAARE